MLNCPQCGAPNIKRSRARGLERLFKRLSSYRSYRCSGCKWRGWLNTGENPWPGIFKKSKRAILFLATVLLIAVAAWLIAETFS